MNKSITKNKQNDKQISEFIKRFFLGFHVSSAWKASNVRNRNKKKEYLCLISTDTSLSEEVPINYRNVA